MGEKQKILRRLKVVLKHQSLLPSWRVVKKAQEITSDPDFHPQELIKIISSDAILTSHLLRIVNAAPYALPQKIVNVEQSIIVLGYKKAIDLCTALAALKMNNNEEEVVHFDRFLFWKHSLATGMACKLIQTEFIGANGADLFTAGLLSNVGRLILDQFFPVEFLKIIATSYNQGISMLDAEWKILKMTHAEIGYHALRQWGMSDNLSLAIRYHHGPVCTEWGMVINLAYVLTHALGFGSPGDPMLTPLVRDALHNFNLHQTQLVKLIQSLKKELELLSPFINDLSNIEEHITGE